jgi:aminomethyltransferase
MTRPDTGYRALREGAAWLDLTGRGVTRVTGEDRARLLHALVSNHVEQLQPGEGCYAFLLNAQGRILADVNILRFADHLLLDTEPETARFVPEHIEEYVIADDVSLEDLTAQTAVLGVEGPLAASVLAALGAPRPEAPCHHAAWDSATVARLTATGAPGWRIFAPAPVKAALAGRLEQAGAVAADTDTIRTVRLENGKPRYGEDLTDKHLPHETQLLHAVHFSKGCYLGQEIVERIRSRGHVHRLLVPLRVQAIEPPPPGARIMAGEGEAGELTSAAFSPALGEVVALGYLRPEALLPGVALTCAGAKVAVTAAKPLEG